MSAKDKAIEILSSFKIWKQQNCMSPGYILIFLTLLPAVVTN